MHVGYQPLLARVVNLRQPHHGGVHAARRQLLHRRFRSRARIPRSGRAVLRRWLAVHIGRDRRARGDHERPVRAQQHLADRLDRLAVVVAVLLKLREVVVEGQVNDAVRLGRSVAQAVEVLDVAMLHLGARLLAELQRRPPIASAPAPDALPESTPEPAPNR